MRIVIQGAGISGLTLGASLQNWDVTILEKDNRIRGIGAGILLHDESLKALSSVGVLPEGRRFDRMNLGFANGRLLPAAPKSGLALSRGKLHEKLIEKNDKSVIKLSSSVVAFTESNDSVEMKLSDGSELEADFLVGADGISSGLRAIHNTATSKKYAGATCWRAVSHIKTSLTQPLELWGDGVRVGIVPLNEGTYLYVTENKKEQGKVCGISLKKFKSFSYDVYRLIVSVSEEDWMQHDLVELDNHFWGSRLVPLLGDAAHAFTPNLGEGAAQAILDSVYLSKYLRDDINYPGKRASRNRHFARLSRWAGHIAQAQGLKSKVRDFVLYPLTSKKRKV